MNEAPPPTGTKTCPACLVEKDRLNDFYQESRGRVSSFCKPCERAAVARRTTLRRLAGKTRGQLEAERRRLAARLSLVADELETLRLLETPGA